MSTKHLSKGSKMPGSVKGKPRLYSNRFCPYAQRVHLVLDAKRIPYETVYINSANKPEWFYDKSTLGKIPALELENGDVLYESLIIADYLDEKYSQNQLYPKDPLQKAKDRILIEQFNKVITNMYKDLLQSSRGGLNDEAIILDGMETFEKELASRGGRYFGGPHKPGMLDYMIWPWCERANLLKYVGSAFSLKKDKFKKLMEWRKRMEEDPAVQKTFLKTEVHTNHLQSFRAGSPQYDIEMLK